jgi:hypothetical protein
VERLASEQIRLLEELRELRDSGILTVDEFEFQVAKVLGRPQAVEPSPVDEEPVTPEETVAEEIPDEVTREEQDVVNGVPAASDEAHESELLEYEFDEPNVSDEDEILAEENQFVESSSTSDISAANIAESEIQQNKSSQRKILIGTTVSLALVAVIGLVALGGGKSDTTSSQIVDNTSTVTQSTTPVTTQAPTTSTTTTTEAIPTTTYEVLQCPYTRVIEAIDGKIVTPEGITFNLRPATYFLRLRDGRGNFREENGYQAGIEVENTTNFRLRIGMELEWSWPNGSLKVLWGPDNGRGWINGFDTRTIGVPDEVAYSQEPITDIQLKIVNATIKYLCP